MQSTAETLTGSLQLGEMRQRLDVKLEEILGKQSSSLYPDSSVMHDRAEDRIPHPGCPQDVIQFNDLLVEHGQSVSNYVTSLLPGYADVQDVTQDVMVTIWKKRESFETGTNFKAWAFRIAYFHVVNKRRKVARNRWLIFDEDALHKAHPHVTSEDMSDPDEREKALEYCLARLSRTDRELLRTRYATNTSLEQFAKKTGQRPGTLKARLFRLRAELRKRIEAQLEAY